MDPSQFKHMLFKDQLASCDVGRRALQTDKDQPVQNRNECSLLQEKEKGSVTKASEPSGQVVGDWV